MSAPTIVSDSDLDIEESLREASEWLRGIDLRKVKSNAQRDRIKAAREAIKEALR